MWLVLIESCACLSQSNNTEELNSTKENGRRNRLYKYNSVLTAIFLKHNTGILLVVVVVVGGCVSVLFFVGFFFLCVAKVVSICCTEIETQYLPDPWLL